MTEQDYYQTIDKPGFAVFKKAGIAFIPYPCDYKVVEEKFSFDDTIMPDVKLLKNWSELLKEMVGLLAYKLTGKA